MKRLKVILILFICLVTISSCGKIPSANEDYAKKTVLESPYHFDFDSETGYFKVLDNDESILWSSYPADLDTNDSVGEGTKNRSKSAIILKTVNYDSSVVESYYSETSSVQNSAVTTKEIDGGYEVSYHFSDIDVTVPLRLILSGEILRTELDFSAIKESGDIHILAVDVLPGMFCGYYQSDGYFLVPDGSGAITDFKIPHLKDAEYEQKVYADDVAVTKTVELSNNKRIGLPVFGIKNESSVSIGIITEGAADAFLIGVPSTSERTYNLLYPRFSLRTQDKAVYNDNRPDVDLFQKTEIYLKHATIEYRIQKGEQLTYADMAGMYREYLMEEYGLKKFAEETLPLHIELTGATITKGLRFGVPVDVVEDLTTYKQAEEILTLLKDGGIDSMVLRYNAWSNETIWGKPLDSLKPASSLGGKGSLKKFLEAAGNMNTKVYAGINPDLVYKGSTVFSGIYEYAKDIRSANIVFNTFKASTAAIDTEVADRYFLHGDRVEKYLSKYSKKLKTVGFQGAAVQTNDALYKDFSSSVPTLGNTVSWLKSGVETLCDKDSGQGILADSVYDYFLPVTNQVMGAQSASSGFEFTDKSVPFVQIVLHGLVNYSLEAVNSDENYDRQFLRSVEYGASLYYQWMYADSTKVRDSRVSELFYAEYKPWMESCIKQHLELSDALKGKQSLFITAHEQLADNVYATTYEDGSCIIVNYSDKDYAADAGTVKALSWLSGTQTKGEPEA